MDLRDAPTLAPAGYSRDQLEILFLLRIVFGSVSFLGSLFIVVCYLWRPRLRRDGLRLVRVNGDGCR